MNSKDEIFKYVSQTLQDFFELEAEQITLDAKLFEELDLDSIDAVDLVVQLQKITGKKIQPEAFKTARTVGDVVDAIYELLN